MTQQLVGDVMTAPVLRVTEDAQFKDIARMLEDNQITAVPVVDAAGRVCGVVSQADLLRTEEYQDGGPRGIHLGRAARQARAKAGGRMARELMTAPVVTVGPRTTLPEAARLMAERKVARLPVVDAEGMPVGIVSRRDLLSVFLRPDDVIAADVFAILDRVFWVDARAFPVEVRDGVVTLTGQFEHKSMVEIMVRLTRAVAGVVNVVNRLGYAVDDTRAKPTIVRQL